MSDCTMRTALMAVFLATRLVVAAALADDVQLQPMQQGNITD